MMNKRKIYGLLTSFILLFAFASCGPVGKGPLDAMPTSTPTPVPLLEQAPLGLKPIIPTLSCFPDLDWQDFTSFCANPNASLGGMQIHYKPYNTTWYAPDGVQCTQTIAGIDKSLACWGSPNEEFRLTLCSSCSLKDLTDEDTFDCADGFTKNDKSECVLVDPTQKEYACPPGSIFVYIYQQCIFQPDPSVPGYLLPYAPVPLCPSDQTYDPQTHFCIPHGQPQVVFACGRVPVSLGDCSVSPNPPGGGNQGAGGSEISCPSDTSWDAGMSCCVNADHRCQ
jgi:hypothetical protein